MIKGGLGNQMFGYAFSKYLQYLGYNTRFEWRDFMFTTHHYGVELEKSFTIQMSKNDHFLINFYGMIGSLSRESYFKRALIKFFLSLDKLRKKLEPVTPFTFVEKHELDVYNFYNGFWQNANYLAPIRKQLLKDFCFRIPDNQEIEIISKILTTNSVSIHVRRGDYLKPEFSSFNVIKDENYFLHAIEYIKSREACPVFFVFSDDLDWCKEKFQGDDFVFVNVNRKEKSYMDMYYMSRCNHNIISNSTFSWWGAWLNQNEKRIVIAPRLWTNDGIEPHSFSPETWVYLDV